jgi:hypothetical protein
MTPVITSPYVLTDIPGFVELVNRDPSSVEESANTLKLSKINYTTKNNQNYKIIRYDKHYLSTDLIAMLGPLRSVILNSVNKVVSFAPPKSISSYLFIAQYPEKTEYIVAEEFVEGTMINVFWDESINLSGAWEIATRNTIGGDTSFYNAYSNNIHNINAHNANNQSKTFRTMFLEAAYANNLDLNGLNKNICYSFVLQHPDNRIVKSFNKPSLYLVEAYEICNTENGIVNVSLIDLSVIKMALYLKHTTIQYPEIYTDWSNYIDLKYKYASMNTPYDIQGVVFRNKLTKERSKMRNPVYEYVRSLRGNQPKLQYQYLCLRQQGSVSNYLTFFPENKKDFAFFRDSLHAFTIALFQNYLACYIYKDMQLKDFPDQYRNHMYNLHQHYMNKLRLEKQWVSKNVVIDYVNKIHPSMQMYCLNSSMRKRRVDIIKADYIEPIQNYE